MAALVIPDRRSARPSAPPFVRVHAPGSPSAPTAAAVYRRRRLVAASLLLLVAWAVVRLVLAVVPALAAPATPTALHTGAPGSAIAEIDRAAGPAAVSGAPVPATDGRLVYVVRPGDTLWTIAAAVRPDRDPREIVDALAARTQGAVIHPGQRIDVAELP